MEEGASLRRKRSQSESYSLPRDQRSSMGVKSSTYTDEQGGGVNSKEGNSNGALLFHGIILKSQLVEMMKHKVFYEENQGVSPKHSKIWSTPQNMKFIDICDIIA